MPSSGGDFMQYVTYENLLTFALVIIGLVTVFVAVLAYKKKEPPCPEKTSGYSLTFHSRA